MTRSSSCRELLEVGGWSLVSLYSQDPSGTTDLCWVRDEADCCLEWVTFSLLLKVSPEFLLGVQTACVGGGGSWWKRQMAEEAEEADGGNTALLAFSPICSPVRSGLSSHRLPRLFAHQ